MVAEPGRRPRSIRSRVTVGAVLIVAAVLILGSLGFVLVLDRSLVQGVTFAVEQDLETLSEQWKDGRLTAADVVALDSDEHLVALFTARDNVVNDDLAELLPRLRAGHIRQVTIDSESYLAGAREFTSEDGDEGGLLVLARSLEQSKEAVRITGGLIVAAVPCALALIGVVIWAVVGRALAPVERIRREVEEIDGAGLDRRVPRTGAGDEIDRLASTMNTMLDRLEHSQRTQHRFVSDASHELRSPLATIKQHAEVARAYPGAFTTAELAEVVNVEGERMGDLVESLLLLARLDERDHLAAATHVDLDDLALAEVSRVQAMGGVTVSGQGIAAARVAGDERLLARAVRNLVDNAARHARSRVAISVAQQGGTVVLHVDDDGAGISPEDRGRIFDRFTRLDEGRSRDEGGSGLGLAIVSEIASAHQGTVNVGVSPWGGARFTLAFPASR